MASHNNHTKLTLYYVISSISTSIHISVAVLDYDDDGGDEDEYYDDHSAGGVGENVIILHLEFY